MHPDDVVQGCPLGCHGLRARSCASRQAINAVAEGRRAMARKRGRGPVFPLCDERCSVGRQVVATLPAGFVPLRRLTRSDWASTAGAQARYLRACAARLEQLEAGAV